MAIYRIVVAMPDRGGHHKYRMKSPLEEYERVVKEGLTYQIDRLFCPKRPAQVSRHDSITL
jgi:hypothetical protein